MERNVKVNLIRCRRKSVGIRIEGTGEIIVRAPLRMPETDAETRREVLDMCYDAVIEIRSLLAQMKKKREYVAEAYLAGNEAAGTMISLDEWGDKTAAET